MAFVSNKISIFYVLEENLLHKVPGSVDDEPYAATVLVESSAPKTPPQNLDIPSAGVVSAV